MLDNGDFVGTIPVDLSKEYDRIPHKLLTAKIKWYGIENGSQRLLLDYLTYLSYVSMDQNWFIF